MTLNEFARFINTKSIGRLEAPVNEQLTERVYSALKKLGNDTTPLKWIVYTMDGQDIMRRIDQNTFVRYPKKPIIDSGEQLDIEESLVDALAYYVMAGLEPQRAKVNMGLYWAEIEAHESNLIQTFLEEASNDSSKFHQLP